MVLGREHDVFHAGDPGQTGDGASVELVGIEGLGQFVEEALQVVLRGPDERVADRDHQLAVEAEVQKHSEARVLEPGLAAGRVAVVLVALLVL